MTIMRLLRTINITVVRSSNMPIYLFTPKNQNMTEPFVSQSSEKLLVKYSCFPYALIVLSPSTTELSFVLMGPFVIESILWVSF